MIPFPIARISCASFLFSLFLCSGAEAETINVAEHGIVPGKDVAFATNRLIESLAGKSKVTLSFPKGQYDFYPENALEKHRAVSNHDNSLKRLAFPLFDLKGITIEGNGSEFLFHGRISPIAVNGCAEVTLRNFSIDWTRSFHDEYEVVARDPKKKTVRLKVDPKQYPFSIQHRTLLSDKYDWQDQLGSNIVFDPKTRAPIYDTKRYHINFFRPHQASSPGKGLIDLQAAFRNEPPPVGSYIISYGRHPTSRLCPAIHLADSKDVVIQGVTIYEAGGMGVIAERTENVHLQKVTVTSNDQRLVSTRADATHFIGCKGHILMEDCVFEHMLDDATNVHGAYVKIVKPLANNQLLCEISHFQQWGLTFAGPGDKVALLSRETILPFYETTVTAVKPLNERRFVVTVADLPNPLPKGPLSLENLTWYPDFTMRNTIVRENRARSVLVTTKGKVLIEGNTFSSQMHGILIEGDNNKWYESGAVQDVTIRDNDFVNIGYEATDRYPIYISPLLNKTQRMGEGHYHRNIRITGNRLKSFNGHFVHATSVTGLTVTDNTITFSTDYPALEKHPAIDLNYVDQATFSNNSFAGFTRPLPIRKSTVCTAVSFQNNTGLMLQK